MKNFIYCSLISFALLSCSQAALSADKAEKPNLRGQIKPEKIEPVKVESKKQNTETKESDSKDADKQENQAIDLDSLGKEKSKSDVPIPVRFASFTTGFVLGAPIAIARCAYKQTRAGTRDLVGDSKNPLLFVPATIISIPFGAMGGPFEGIGYSAVNSWKASREEPFSEEAFSLGDSIE